MTRLDSELRSRGAGDVMMGRLIASPDREGTIIVARPITPQDFDAVLFDLDGVLTTTRTLHAAAWKLAFDEFLAAWDARRG